MYKDEVGVRDERRALSGCIGASYASRKFANIALAMESEKGPDAVSELRMRL